MKNSTTPHSVSNQKGYKESIIRKEKSHLKMFVWYVFTEPYRKVKEVFVVTGHTLNVDFVAWIFFILGALIYANNPKNPAVYFAAFIVIVLMLYSSWSKKKFVNVYRKEHYKLKK